MPPPDLPDDDFVPLTELKPKPIAPPPTQAKSSTSNNTGARKTVNEKSLAELRAVLNSFKNKNSETPKVVQPPPKEIKEIPEEDLKKMLHVDQDK
jgi:hypothetical protein